MALFYLDASALAKLVRREPESAALRTFLDGADIVSSELVLAEIPRAIRRAAASDPALPLKLLMKGADELLDAIGLLATDREILIAAGMLGEPALRALDAIPSPRRSAPPPSKASLPTTNVREPPPACAAFAPSRRPADKHRLAPHARRHRGVRRVPRRSREQLARDAVRSLLLHDRTHLDRAAKAGCGDLSGQLNRGIQAVGLVEQVAADRLL